MGVVHVAEGRCGEGRIGGDRVGDAGAEGERVDDPAGAGAGMGAEGGQERGEQVAARGGGKDRALAGVAGQGVEVDLHAEVGGEAHSDC